jgi:hypothetical protein
VRLGDAWHPLRFTPDWLTGAAETAHPEAAWQALAAVAARWSE